MFSHPKCQQLCSCSMMLQFIFIFLLFVDFFFPGERYINRKFKILRSTQKKGKESASANFQRRSLLRHSRPFLKRVKQETQLHLFQYFLFQIHERVHRGISTNKKGLISPSFSHFCHLGLLFCLVFLSSKSYVAYFV